MGQRDFIGSFRLVRLVRSGRNTQVWEARKNGEKEKCALKILLESQKKNKKEIEALRHEATVGKTFDHKNVIKIFEYYGNHNQPFVHLQLFNARNLKQWIRESHLILLRNMEQVIRDCAESLDYIHEQGWLHCDIKPDNFLMDEDLNIKLIDFSIAQQIKKKGFSLFGGSKKIQGTRSYMAPEQIRGKHLGPTADIYGFGCMVFELIAGRAPFTGTTSDDLLQKHLSANPPNLMATGNRVREDFSALVQRMLAKEPAKRPQSMRAFLSELAKTRVFRAGTRFDDSD